MTTLTRSFATYEPEDNPEYAIPVQQGTVLNLSLAITPNRQGVLGWVDPTANELRCAVVPDFDDVFTDDVVPAGDVRTVLDVGALGRTIHTGVIWGYEGNLYAFVSHLAGNNGKTECYIADDIENPTVWTFRGMVQERTTTNPVGVLTVEQGGGPTVLTTGRWVLPFHSWVSFSGTLEDGLGLYSCDDDGVTWDIRVSVRRSPLGGGTAGPQSTTVAWEPADSLYWFGSIIGSVAQWRPYSSADTDTWADNEQSGGNYNPYYYMDDGTTLYAGLVSSGAMRLYEVVDATDPTTWVDLGMNGIITNSISVIEGFQIMPMLWPTTSVLHGVAFTAKDRIAYSPVCDPIHPDPLFIPFKERLQLIVDDFTEASIRRSQSDQFDNWKVIERWAEGFIRDTNGPARCILTIPFKEHAREEWDTGASQSFENWKAVERWADYILSGVCGCNCGTSQRLPDECMLFVPWKGHMLGIEPLDADQLARAADQEFDNFKTLERWGNMYARGECGCTSG